MFAAWKDRHTEDGGDLGPWMPKVNGSVLSLQTRSKDRSDSVDSEVACSSHILEHACAWEQGLGVGRHVLSSAEMSEGRGRDVRA